MAFSRRGFLRALGAGMAMSAVPAMPTLAMLFPLSHGPAAPEVQFFSTATKMLMGLRARSGETLQRALANSSRYPVSNDALVARGRVAP